MHSSATSATGRHSTDAVVSMSLSLICFDQPFLDCVRRAGQLHPHSGLCSLKFRQANPRIVYPMGVHVYTQLCSDAGRPGRARGPSLARTEENPDRRGTRVQTLSVHSTEQTFVMQGPSCVPSRGYISLERSYPTAGVVASDRGGRRDRRRPVGLRGRRPRRYARLPSPLCALSSPPWRVCAR